MNKRLSAMAGFLPMATFLLLVETYDAVRTSPPLFPYTGTAVNSDTLAGLVVGGILPGLGLSVCGSMAGLLFALIQHRLPVFRRSLQGGLFYACFHAPLIIPLLLLCLRPNIEHLAGMAILCIVLLTALFGMGVGFIWIYSKFAPEYEP